MKNFFQSLFIVLLFHSSNAQNKLLWKGYFSYNEIKDVSQSQNKFFAASENALFSKNTTTGEIKTTNTIDGLSSQTISALYYSSTFNKTLVGYENGLLIVINENDGTILNVVDIINKQIAPNIKKINHFNEYNGVVYLACDYGIVQYNLNTLQFGETYFIGSSIPEIKVNQTTVFDGYFYAATLNEGLKRAAVDNPNLIDATQWEQVNQGSFSNVTAFKENVFAISTSGQISKSNNGIDFFSFSTTLSPSAVDLRTLDDNLVVTTTNKVIVFNPQLNIDFQVNANQIQDITAVFTCATIVKNNLYIGSLEHGVIVTSKINSANFDFISPNGPARNSIFSINAQSSNLWAVYGEYDQFYTPLIKSRGYSKFNEGIGWTNFPFSNVDNAVDLVRVTFDPLNEERIFISSYTSGLLEFENDVLVKHYDHLNSGLEKLDFPSDPNYISVRIEQSAFDKTGNLWLTNGLIKNGLKVLKPNNQWQSYNMENVVNNIGLNSLGKITIDKNGTKWISSLNDGLLGFNETFSTDFKKLTEGTESGSLPQLSVQAVAIDNRNQMWIGTRKGLRVMSSIDSFLSEEPLTAFPIIILEDGLAQELLFEQFITDIVVDGANNKWVGTNDAGVFLFSPNGQETIYQFNSSNSPLPSNNISDIDINQTTGEVFFATTKGMVSFKGTAIKASDDLSNVVVYPNPVRPEYSGTVKITGLLNKANIKITDIEGNLVHEVISEGGSIEWDTTAFGKYKVASGVYMIFISAQDGIETKVKKVMIVR